MGKRIILGNQHLNNTCENSRFKTDINKGYAHFSSQNHFGSVTKTPIYDDSYASLFLEHVIEIKNNKSVFWLMWYNSKGEPLLAESAVFDEADLLKIIQNLSSVKL